MIILGIETSCDETALALIETRGDAVGADFECRVLASLIHSQAELHSAYGGVYPNLAKREHGKNLVPLLEKVLRAGMVHLPQVRSKGSASPKSSSLSEENHSRPQTSLLKKLEPFRTQLQAQNPDLWESLSHGDFLVEKPPIDRIAVTEGPGLEPALWVGIVFAQVLSKLWDVPIIPVNHMEGHVVGSLLKSDKPDGEWQKLHELPLPAVALLISGGHTELVAIQEAEHGSHGYVRGLSERSEEERVPQDIGETSMFCYEIIGQTKDDAVGEAFDKAARLLGLPYPGGPHLAKLAHEAWEQKIPSPVKLPRPMIGSGDLDFSFSGLKTAVLYAVRDATRTVNGDLGKLSDEFKKGLAYEFEQAVADVLSAKLRAAIEAASTQAVVIGGGVSANHVLRKRFEAVAAEYGIPLFMPSQHISGDNALMIALAGASHEADTKTPGSLRAHGTKRLGA